MGRDVTTRRKGRVREVAELAATVLLLLAARSSLADHYYIPSGSMEHTLVAGDRVFVDKRAYGMRVPFTRITVFGERAVERGEVAIFDSPADGERLIKRIVAVPGDEVLLRRGRLTVNGEALGEAAGVERFDERSALLNLAHGGGPDAYIASVPDGMLLAIGDHRGNSIDSRAFGLIPQDALYGRAVAIYYRRGEAFTWRPL